MQVKYSRANAKKELHDGVLLLKQVKKSNTSKAHFNGQGNNKQPYTQMMRT